MTRVTWIGHSTVIIDTAGRRLLTDPVLGQGIGLVRRRAAPSEIEVGTPDAVLISHLHHDHLDLPSLQRVPREAAVILPMGGGRLLRPQAFADVREVDRGDRTAVGRVRIRAVPALHEGRRLPFGPSAPALGYVIEGEHRIYFAVDTEIFPEMASIARDLDLAILPVGGWGPTLRGGHMDPVRAASALVLLHPRHALAVHWGTLWPVGLDRVRRARFEEPARDFIDEASRVAPDVTVAMVDPGGHLSLSEDGWLEVVR
jgi:L-ascorbate metabolism protein UlaG (beta-lactamase superfamily)